MDDLDRRAIDALQDGFPVCERPYLDAARHLGTTEPDLLARVESLLAEGTLTRFGPLFQVERMGGAFLLAAMSVPEERFDTVARTVNALPEVAHNYARTHALNMWFVLAAETLAEIEAAIAAIEASGRSLTGLLVDYHLDRGNGVAAIREIRRRFGESIPAILITADRSPNVRAAAREENIAILNKPVKPASLRALLGQWRAQQMVAAE
jgi:DNA-binding Lrp family transcriptional regulator